MILGPRLHLGPLDVRRFLDRRGTHTHRRADVLDALGLLGPVARLACEPGGPLEIRERCGSLAAPDAELPAKRECAHDPFLVADLVPPTADRRAAKTAATTAIMGRIAELLEPRQRGVYATAVRGTVPGFGSPED